MAKGLSVFVNIGAKLLPSLNSAASGVERRFGLMSRRLRVQAAETKLAWRQMSAAVSPIAAFAAAGGLAMTLKGAIGAGAEYQHQISMMKNMGRTAVEMSQAIRQAHKTAFEVPTSSWTENLKTFNETVMAFGSVAHATENLSFVQKMSAVFDNALGSGHGLTKDQSYSLIKALEMRGMGTKAHPGFDSGRFQKEASLFAQANIASGGKVTPEELFNFTKKASPFVQGFSDRYLWRIAPTLIQEQGGDVAGSQNASWIGTILGKAKNKITTEAYMRLGLLDPKQIVYNKVGPVGWRPGAMKGTNLAMSDPLAWTEKVLLPALKAHGVDTGSVLAMQKALLPLFRDRNANRLAVMLASQQTNTNLHKDERLIGKVPGVGSAYASALKNDPLMASKALHGSVANLKTALGNAMFSSGVVTAINALARGINWMAEAFDKHPNFARGVDALMGLGLAAATLKTFGLAARWAFSPVTALLSKIGSPLWRMFGPMLFRGLLSAGTFIRAGFMALAPAIGEGLMAAFALLSNPVGWAVLAGIAIVAAGAFVWHFRKKIAYGLGYAWKSLSSFVTGIDWSGVGKRVLSRVARGLGYAWATVSAWWKKAWDGIISFIEGIDWLKVGKAIASGIWSGLKAVFSPSTWSNLLSGVVGGASSAWGTVKSSFAQGEAAAAAPAHGVIVPHSELVRRRAERQAATAPVIHIHGAHDPHAVAREVDRVLKRHAAGQAGTYAD